MHRTHTFPALLLLGPLVLAPRPATAYWTSGSVPVCTASHDQTSAVAVSDGSGGMIVAWVDSRLGNPDIYAMRVGANGNFAPGWPDSGRALCTMSGDQILPEIATDGVGGAFVVWQDKRNGTVPAVYAQHVTAAGDIAAGWPANGVALCSQPSNQAGPVMVSDGAGGALVAWTDNRDGTFSIYAQRVSSSGALQWGATGLAVCDAVNDQMNPAIAADGAGGALFAWEDGRASTGSIAISDIYVVRLTSAGALAPGWPANGVPATPTTGLRLAYVPTLVADGAGGPLLAWEDYRNISGDIYAQHLTGAAALATGWSAGGMAVCDTSGDQIAPMATADGSGGMLVVWKDARAGSSNDLYAQRLAGDGTRAPGWLAQGAPVCTATGDQSGAQLIDDGAGGLIVTWFDYRAGVNTDIYALRLTAAGELASGWVANGTPICTAAGSQQLPTLVSDGAGGALIAWSDFRSGVSFDIYAQRVTSAGVVAPSVDVPVGTPSRLRVMEPAPNPARAQTSLAFDLPGETLVDARVYDVAGRPVRTLAEDARFGAGTHRLAWDGLDASGRPAAAGVYFIRVRAGAESAVRRVVRLE